MICADGTSQGTLFGYGGTDAVAPAVPGTASGHACSDWRWLMTGSTAERRRNSRLIYGVARRFRPEMDTLNLSSGGALWPR